jgi:DNA-directed RNA polymerase subunit M/transcription elongation factor TFIIS
MDALDPASEWLHLSERYRQMSDGELLVLARQKSGLTDAAQKILASEMSRRGLKVQAEELAIPANPEPQGDSSSSYDEDRELVEICTVWSLPDALQLQALLDTAGIPFFMGPEKTTGVDSVTSNFANGVSVRIMKIGLPWSRPAMQHYAPADEPLQKQGEELEELPVRCPKCQSTEVIFEGLSGEEKTATDDSSSRFQWKCDACGHEWEDEGVVKEE